uniref:Uncharacterized protein n=1 Tax=Arundo donax TaxID=35708 RepID=A0A0A9A3Q7_ARUDO
MRSIVLGVLADFHSSFVESALFPPILHFSARPVSTDLHCVYISSVQLLPLQQEEDH